MFERALRVLVGNHVAEERVAVIPADRRIQRGRLDPAAFQRRDLRRTQPDLVGQFLVARIAPQFEGQVLGQAADLGNLLHLVHRHADRFALVGQRALDRLLDPPRGVSAQLAAFFRIEALDGFHQADVALRDKIEQRKSEVRVIGGQLYHQTQVRRDHTLARRFVPALDPCREFDFLRGCK